jgi:hypothetical protein
MGHHYRSWVLVAKLRSTNKVRSDLVKLCYPSLCNFARKLPEKERNSDSKLVSCKYWDTTVGMLMVGISAILSATNYGLKAIVTQHLQMQTTVVANSKLTDFINH